MCNQISSARKDVYKFKHNDRVVRLDRIDAHNFNLSYGESSKQFIFELVFMWLMIIAGAGAGWKSGNLVYSKLLTSWVIERKYDEPWTILSFLDEAAQEVRNMISILLAALVGFLVLSAIIAVAACVVKILVKDFKTTIMYRSVTDRDRFSSNELYDTTEYKVPIFFEKSIQPYLHLLDPEVLYNYLNAQSDIITKTQEAAKMIKYSHQLKDGFLKNEVLMKHAKIVKEKDELNTNIYESMNNERNKLKELSKVRASLKRQDEYSKLEEKVLKELAS